MSNQSVGALPLYLVKAEFFKALGHPARIRILEVLSGGERSVGEIQPEVGLEASHLSQQLAVLRRAGFLQSRRDGAHVYYSLRDRRIARLLAVARSLLLSSLSETRDMLTDLEESTA